MSTKWIPDTLRAGLLTIAGMLLTVAMATAQNPFPAQNPSPAQNLVPTQTTLIPTQTTLIPTRTTPIPAAKTDRAGITGHGVIKGSILDSATGSVLEDATVRLFHMPGQTLMHQTRSSHTGFAFSGVEPGRYRIVTSFLGYADDTVGVELSPADSTAILLKIRMSRFVHPMPEVIIHAILPPMMIRGDTLVYNAAAFPTRPFSTIEDLLRRLPGVVVGSDGGITIYGRKVDKILLNGKEYFLGDLLLATRNLPAEIATQIEAFDTHTDLERMMGTQGRATTTTINIKVAEDHKRGVFGDAYAGLANQQGYVTGGKITKMTMPRMLMATVNTNNINNLYPAGPGNLNLGPLPGVQSSKSIHLNYHDEWSKNLVATANFGANGNDRSIIQSSSRQTFAADSVLLENRASAGHFRSTRDFGNFLLELKPDSQTQMNFRGAWSDGTSHGQSQDTVAIITQKPAGQYLNSNGLTRNTNDGRNDMYNCSVDLSRKLRRGRSVYGEFHQSVSTDEQPASLYSLVNGFDSTGATVQRTLQDQQSHQTTKNSSYGLVAAYSQPLGSRHTLYVNYSYNRAAGYSDKQSMDFDSLTGKYDRPDTLTSSRFRNFATTQQFVTKFANTAGKYIYSILLTGQLTDLENDDRIHSSVIRQHALNWLPQATLDWQPKSGASMHINYSGATRVPTISELQPVADLTNPFVIRVGNPDLKQQMTHDFSAIYTSSKPYSGVLMIITDGNYIQHQIASSSTILAGGIQQIEAVNVEGVYHFRSTLHYSRPMSKQHPGNNVSFGLNTGYGHDKGFVNGQENTSAVFSYGVGASMNYMVGTKFYLALGANVDDRHIHYSISETGPQEFLSQQAYLFLNYQLPAGISFSTNYNFQNNGKQGALPATQVSLLNASIGKSLLSEERAILKFSVFDLLNNSKNITQSTGANYALVQQTNLRGRVLLLSFLYQFKRFPDAKPREDMGL